MQIKVFHDPISPAGEVLDRDAVLNSDDALMVIAFFELKQKQGTLPQGAISAAMIFDELIKRKIISSLKPRAKVQLSKLVATDEQQKFTENFLTGGEAEGWLVRKGAKITIHGLDGDVVFAIKQEPGRYCCHCGEKLPDDGDGKAARKHVAEKHAGKTSPDAENPSGYVMQNYYNCALEVNHG